MDRRELTAIEALAALQRIFIEVGVRVAKESSDPVTRRVLFKLSVREAELVEATRRHGRESPQERAAEERWFVAARELMHAVGLAGLAGADA